MEGQYNRVYRARDRVPRPEYAFLLDRLVAQVRSVLSPVVLSSPEASPNSSHQIGSTVEASYPTLPYKDAFDLLFFKQNESAQLDQFIIERKWAVRPGTGDIVFPESPKADIRHAAVSADVSSTSLDVLKGKGVAAGVPMNKLIAPSLRLALQLEMIV